MVNTDVAGTDDVATTMLLPSAPSAMPAIGTMLLVTDPRVSCKSTSAAPNAEVAAPVAKPCRARAVTSSVAESADKKTMTATICRPSAPLTTARRPQWFDSDPPVSRASIRATGYVANTTVITIGLAASSS
ncbi:hypothetical protein GCM10027344_23140 [Spelaeicoccus albus]